MVEKQANRKEGKGITLIALVITIIVLLILAGVAIAILTEDNGLLNQIERATEETEKAEIIERAKTDILDLQAENISEDITIGQLKEVLNKYFEGVPEKDKLPKKLKSKSEYGGYEIEILDIYNGTLTDITASEVNALIGQTVTSYTENSGEVTDWRIFYASDEEMFLISSNVVESSTAFEGTSGIPLKRIGATQNYDGAIDVFSPKTGSGEGYSYSNVEYGKTYNKLWYNTETTSKNLNAKAVAYLCDPANWTKYIGNNAPSGTYAVGSPTQELLVLSWNQAVENGGKEAPTATAIWEDGDVVQTGYFANKPDEIYSSFPIRNTILNGLYNDGNSYWLASTNNGWGFNLNYVLKNGYITNTSYNVDIGGVRPLVSVPISNVQIENGIITIANN